MKKEKLQKLYRSAAINAMPSTAVAAKMTTMDYAPRRGMGLFGVDGWIRYSGQSNWYVSNRVIVIRDRESGEYNAIRVTPDSNCIDNALESLKPAAVKKAEKSKKTVLRQGDMYFIPQKSWNMDEIVNSNHVVEYQSGRNQAYYTWTSGEKLNGNPVYITHPHHKTVILNSPHKVKQQITAFGRGHAD